MNLFYITFTYVAYILSSLNITHGKKYIPGGISMQINAVFEGGGVKGISLVGAIRAAEQQGIIFRQVAGTSSGAMVAAFLAAGYTAEEMEQLIFKMPFSSFLQRAPIFQFTWLGPIVRLLWKKGLYSGVRLEQWVHECLLKKGIRTFGDLKQDQLKIIVSDISNGRLVVLPDDIVMYGLEPKKLLVSQAIRMSTSIPYFFDPVLIRHAIHTETGRSKKFSRRFSYIVDGGLLSNFPLWLFDNEEDSHTQIRYPTIGFQMVGKQDHHPYRIKGIITMMEAIFDTMISAHDQRYISKQNHFRTIKIPTLGIKATDFHLTLKQSQQLYMAGQEAGQRFFQQWDNKLYERMFAIHCNSRKKS